jgi:hypothetical protein
MGKYTGDRSRQNRQRRKKLARRVSIRALRQTLGGKGEAKRETKTVAAATATAPSEPDPVGT